MRHALENPELMKLWIDDFLSGKDIRQCYPYWDELVGAVTAVASDDSGMPIDAEIFCMNLLTCAVVGPRVFRNCVCPTDDTAALVRRFGDERRRVLKHSALLRE